MPASKSARHRIGPKPSPLPKRKKVGAPPSQEYKEDAIMHRVLEGVPENEMKRMLEVSDDPRFLDILRQMIAPDTPIERRRSLFSMAKSAGISVREMIDFMHRYHVDIALLRVSRRLPDMLENTAIDADTRVVECSRCEGAGQVIEKRRAKTCPSCHGDGTVRKLGDIDRLKLIWDTTGLIKNKGGASVNIPISFGGERTDSFEGMVGRAADAMTSVGRPALPALAEEVKDGDTTDSEGSPDD